MKQIILTVILMTSVLIGTVAAEKKGWTCQVGFTDSSLNDETVIGAYGTSDYVDDTAIGFNTKGHYAFNELFALGAGYHAVSFEEDSWTPIENTTDIEASAFYITAQFSGPRNIFEGYGSFELGISDLEDVDYNLPSSNISGLNMYKGGTGTYWSIGGGVMYHMNDMMFLDLIRVLTQGMTPTE